MTSMIPALVSQPAEPTKTSASILAALLSEAKNERRRETLQRLEKACDALEKAGITIRISDIQRHIEKTHGKEAGPKAQSISNERLRPLGMLHYVEARERERQAALPKPKSPARPGRGGDPAAALANRISDTDVRSAVLDLYDRCVTAEKNLERAKTLLKTLNPGANFQADGSAIPNLSSEPIGLANISREQIQEMERLLSILSDNEKLANVGLCNDNGRVRRKSGTKDEMIDARIMDSLSSLIVILRNSNT